MQAILRQSAVIGRRPLHTLTPSEARTWLNPRFEMLGRERKEVSKLRIASFKVPQATFLFGFTCRSAAWFISMAAHLS
jgi:hypothetical protein